MLKKLAVSIGLIVAAVLFSAAPALAEAPLAPSPARLEFGPVDLHFGGSPHESVQLTNESQSAVFVFGDTISGTNASRFQIVGNGCGAVQLQPGESCSIEVSFQPASQALELATLEVFDSEGSLEVGLSGSGVTGTLSANPDPLMFSAIPSQQADHEGEYSETETITLSDSVAGTQLESVTLTGPDASSFSIQWTCSGDLLAAGNTCSVGVRFAPVSPGPKNASLVIDSDSAGSPLVVPLQGEGLNGPHLSISSIQALLGNVPLGSSAQHTFTITNDGDYPLVVQQDFLVSGTPLMFPIVADGCGGHVLPPNTSCALTVGFEPSTIGEKDASIVFITNTSPITVVGIDGVGVAAGEGVPSPPSAEVAPAGTGVPAPPSATVAPAGTGVSAAVTPAGEGRHRLVIERAPLLLGSLAGGLLDTGILARCPSDTRGCQALALVTTSAAGGSRARARRASRTALLVGSALEQLRAGQSTRLRLELSRHAIHLLAARGHLRVTIETVIRAPTGLFAEQVRTVTLLAPAGAALRPLRAGRRDG